MKVLHVDTGKTWRGGQQQVCYLHTELLKKGVESHLVCPEGSELYARSLAAGLPVTPMGLRGEWDLFSARKISALLQSGGYRILHLHSSHAQGIGMAAAFMARFLNVVVTRRVDFVPKAHFFNRFKYGPGVARFVAISTAIYNILKEYGIEESRLRLVPSGVDPQKPRPGTGAKFRKRFSIPADAFVVGNIGALADHKGQRYLVEAAPLIVKERPDARVVIVGDGELAAELKALAQKLGVGKSVLFTGFRPDIEAALDSFNVFAMPSVMEGLGTAVLDAFAAGKPVVAARSGGIPDLVESGEDGLLVPPANPEELAAAVISLMNDRERATALAAKALEKVATRFSSQAMAEGNLKVYRELVGDG